MKTTAKTFTHPRRSDTSDDVTPALTRANSTRLWLILRKYSCAAEKPVESPRILSLLLEVRAWSRNPIDAADSARFRDDRYPSFKICTQMYPPPNSAKLAKGALILPRVRRDPCAFLSSLFSGQLAGQRCGRKYCQVADFRAVRRLRIWGRSVSRMAGPLGVEGDAKSGHGASTSSFCSRGAP